MRSSKTTQARAWVAGLVGMIIIAALLIVVVNPLNVAVAYLALLTIIALAGLVTNLWGGLTASALGVFAIVLFNIYAGIYVRESRILNIGTELGALMLVGPLAGGLAGALNRLQNEAEYWLAHADELTVRDATFDTLKPEWARTRLEEETRRAALCQRPLSIAMVHLQPAPDAPPLPRAERVGALQAVIRVARVVAPLPAVVAHMGGDQVLLILPEQTTEQAQQTITSLQTQLTHAVYFPSTNAKLDQALGKPLSVWGTLRAGVATLNSQLDNGESLLLKAKAELEG